MPEIKVLPKAVAELIAAGEVVERPSSAIKELVENSIDAGSTLVTVEIKNGGVTFMRVTDNGCGIARKGVTTAFLRHATSKISAESDLYEIATLGFRGEALAAISSVSRIQLLTKTKDEETGTLYTAEGGNDVTVSDAGCPDGTTIIVRDLFFNTPARMKFLKKDIAEGNSVSAMLTHIALSRPEVSFRFIRDGKQVFSTPGDGKLLSAVYAVCGREFAATLIPVNSEADGIKVSGFVSKPTACKPKRNAQLCFLNGRFVRSGTVSSALETAYKNSIMVGKYPAAVLHLTVPYGAVDINVHPAKTEVRFSDERRIFDSVLYAVKNALLCGDARPEMTVPKQTKMRMTAEEYRQTVLPGFNDKRDPIDEFRRLTERAANNGGAVRFGTQSVFDKPAKPETPKKEPYRDIVFGQTDVKTGNFGTYDRKPVLKENDKKASELYDDGDIPVSINPAPVSTQSKPENELAEKVTEVKETEPADDIKYIGEAFSAYIIVSRGESIFIIDKHAAHERMLFNELKKNASVQKQYLLSPEQVALHGDEYTAVTENTGLLDDAGFEIEDYGDDTVLVRAIPSVLTGEGVAELISEIAVNLYEKHSAEIERLERIYETVSCRAAIKAGNISSQKELEALAKAVLSSRDIMYCPHGRPVAFELKKKEIERQFGRIQ